MSFTRRLALGVVALAVVLPVHSAEERKEKRDAPRVVLTVPFAVVAGTTNQVLVRGLSLTNATGVQFCSQDRIPRAEIRSVGKASMPEKGDPTKVGNTQLELELVLLGDFPDGDLPFIIQTSEGPTNTNLLRVVPAKLWLLEIEPNAAFREPNAITVPRVIQGMMGEANDVDVFRFRGKRGQRIFAETRSIAYGSLLDPTVTLHDARGHVLATSDDAGSRDAKLSHLLAQDGDYFLSVNDAHDRGGLGYTYLLEVGDASSR